MQAPTRSDLFLLGAAAILAFLVLLPTATLVIGSLTTGRPGPLHSITPFNYLRVLTDPRTYRVIVDTSFFALATTGLSLLMGSVLGFLVIRTNIALRGMIHSLIILTFIVPIFIHALMWILLLSPRIGLYNIFLMRVLGLEKAPFDLFSWPGLIWVESLSLMPLVYLSMSTAFMSLDPSLEEAANSHGSGTLSTLVRVTLPLLRPVLLSMALLLLVLSFESFLIPLVIGIPAGIFLFTARIYSSIVSYPPSYGDATTLSVLAITIVAFLALAHNRFLRRSERFVTVSGRGIRPRVIDLGSWRHPVSLLIVMFLSSVTIIPILLLVFVSLQSFYDPIGFTVNFTLEQYGAILDNQLIVRGTINSLALGALGALFIVLLTFFTSYIVVRTRIRGRKGLDALAMTPVALPGITIALGLLWAYVVLPIGIYGTPFMLLIGYTTKYLPYSQRMLTGGFHQLHVELEEASRTAGGGWFATIRFVIAPLMKPAALAGWIVGFMLIVKDISTAALLVSSGSEVLSTIFLQFLSAESFPLNAALAVYILIFVFVISFVALKILRVRFE